MRKNTSVLDYKKIGYRVRAALNVSVDSFLYDSPTPFTGYLLKNAIPQKVNQLSNGYWVKDAKSRSSLFLENRIAVILVQKPCRSV